VSPRRADWTDSPADAFARARPKPAKAVLLTSSTTTERATSSPGEGAGPESAFQRHYTVEDLSALWNVSEDFVRRLFLCEPGVVVFYKHRPGRRVYRTLRIPESVAVRVHRRMTKR
jgi:hypothetical protein